MTTFKDELNKVLDKFKVDTEDLWEHFMEGDDPDPQKYDQFLDNAYNDATQAIIELVDRELPKDKPPINELGYLVCENRGYNQAIQDMKAKLGVKNND